MKLLGKTKKGRQRTRRDGSTGWRIVRVTDSVLFSNRVGPWLLIENDDPHSRRWIHSVSDNDFELKE